MVDFRIWCAGSGGRLLAVTAAALGLGLGLSGCGRDDAPASQAGPAPGIPVAVAEAIPQDVEVIRRSVGTIRAVEAVDVTSEVEGTIQQILFEESSRVRTGDVLVRLNAREAEAELAAAQARRDRIARQYESLDQLYQRGAATSKEYQDIRSELVEAEAQVRLAQIVLDNHTIRAPFDGQVGLRQRSVGAWVRAGDPLVTLVSVDPVEARFQLPEQAMAEVRPGQHVSLRSPAYPGRAFIGRVVAIDSAVNTQTRTLTVAAYLDNPEGLLRPGMFADVELVTDVRHDAVVVPEMAISTRGQDASVLVVEEGKAMQRRVVIGQRRGGLVEIRQGLTPGAVVVTSDPGQVRDGAEVDPRPDQTLAALGIDGERFIRGLPATITQAHAPTETPAPAAAAQ